MNTEHYISTEEFETIEQYLLGAISNEEKQAFKKRIESDSLLALKVKEVKLLLAGIETTSLKERLDIYHTGIKKNSPQKAGGKIILFNRKLLVAASVLVLAAVSVWLFVMKGNRYEKMYADYYKPDPGLMTAMGISGNYQFEKAMVDYKTGNYKKAIDEWSKLKTDMPHNDTLNYFLGAAQQADGNSATALTLLKQIANDTAKPFYKDACWYTGLALVKEGAVNEAIPYLEKSGRPESIELISKLK